MVKKVALINDISGLGRCSLTAAIPVLAAMGVQPCPVPTALLSAQTGFPDYYCENCEHILPAFAEKWEKMGVELDGIFTGFCTDPAQVDAMIGFVDRFKREGSHVLVDPILGDDGVTYKFYSDELRKRYLALTERATIITPNLTELCILAGADFSALDHANWDRLQEEIAGICERLCCSPGYGDMTILVTGIGHGSDDRSDSRTAVGRDEKKSSQQMISGSTGTATSVFFDEGIDTIATGVYAGGSWTTCDSPLLPGSFSGTGDLFASVIIAAAVKGYDPVDAVRLAQRFLSAAIKDSIDHGVYPPEGTDFEPHLYLLMEDKH